MLIRKYDLSKSVFLNYTFYYKLKNSNSKESCQINKNNLRMNAVLAMSA